MSGVPAELCWDWDGGEPGWDSETLLQPNVLTAIL